MYYKSKTIITILFLLSNFIIFNNSLANTYILSPGDTITFLAKNSLKSINNMEDVSLSEISYPPFVSIQESFPSIISAGKVGKLIFVVNSDAGKCSEGIITFKLTHNNQTDDIGIMPDSWEQSVNIAIDCDDEVFTNYGGSNHEAAKYVTADNSGNLYISGWTESNDGISTPDANQTILLHSTNGFLSKFNQAGMIHWGTYYYAGTTNAVTTDELGFLYITGHQSYLDRNEAYLAKFNADTGEFLWEKYFGSDNYTGTSLVADENHVYLAGWANVGSKDAILVKFDTSGNKIWRRICGGNQAEYGHGVAVDKNGNTYLVGETKSSFGPGLGTEGTHQPNFGGNIDAFLSKFDTSGNQLWGTYFGGTGLERGFSVVADSDGNVFIAGETRSIESIASQEYKETYGGGTSDAFIAKFNGSDGKLVWARYYGGSNFDLAKSIIVDVNGAVYVTGETQSTDIDNCIKKTNTDMDAFVVKFDKSGIRQWSAVYGGSYSDSGESIAISGSSAAVYMVGTTNSNKNGEETDTFINIARKLYPPIISHETEVYNSPQSVSITTGIEGASIKYTTDGSLPTCSNGIEYNGVFTIIKNTTVKAIVVKSGFIASDTSEKDYQFKAYPPTFSPIPDIYNYPQTISIQTTFENASIRYTTDGTDPTSSTGNEYNQPFTISENTTIKAIVYKDGCNDSEISEVNYIIKPDPPNIIPESGTYNSVNVTINTSFEGASIRYTNDGTWPTLSTGFDYIKPFAISDTSVVRAIAYKIGCENSDLAESIYKISNGSIVSCQKGDVNYNKILDLQDVIISLKIIAGMDETDICLDADVNNDKLLSLEEAIYILQFLAEINH